MSNTRIIQSKPVNPSVVKVIKDVTIETSGWVDDTLVSGFWYYDYSNNLIKEYMNVDIEVAIENPNLDLIKSIASSGVVRVYSSSQPATFICDIAVYGGGA